VNDLFTALIKSVCDLQDQINANSAAIAVQTGRVNTIEANYTISCLEGVTASSGTHDILQATINKLCAFIINVEANYVLLADLDALIAAYLASQSPGTNYYTSMVPYIAYEYYGSLIGFDPVTGVGSGVWEKVYICNGYNGLTPDKRGRVAVGATTGMGGGTLNPAVDPALGNPSYTLQGLQGSNNILLTTSQIPLHTHTATSVVTDPGHSHLVNTSGANPTDPGNSFRRAQSSSGDGYVSLTSSRGPGVQASVTGITVGTTVDAAGGGTSHPNFQPGIGCFYIMYIP
jgi:microcystin-dependent protein